MMRASEWEWIERGLKQRIQALNLFLDDVYHDQKIVKDRIIPREIIQSADSFRPAWRRPQSAEWGLVPYYWD